MKRYYICVIVMFLAFYIRAEFKLDWNKPLFGKYGNDDSILKMINSGEYTDVKDSFI